jgi:predicted lipoprotein with Yx(FWY)xxD motif
MMTIRRTYAPLVTLLLAAVLAGCGGDDDTSTSTEADAADAAAETTSVETPETTPPPLPSGTTAAPGTEPPPAPDLDLAKLASRPPGEEGLRVAAERARLVAADSKFGTVLFDANGQVLYAFENDSRGRSACTSADCVKAWPPMLTEGAPTAGPGIDASRLGTITREDGSKQVTYFGRPLYFYEHEAPGEIKCHDVNLHGGLWWVVQPDGENAP